MSTKAPNVYVMTFLLIILAAAATWIIPGGAYHRNQEQVGGEARQVIVPGTFAPVERNPQSIQIFRAPIQGFNDQASIIIFILILGGAFSIINESGTLTAVIPKLVSMLGKRTHLVIPLTMFLFSFFGATFGMCEEAMPFVSIFVPLAISLGYDSLVGVCMSFVGAGVGFASGFMNPITVQVPQNLAGLSVLTGSSYRTLVWFLSTAFAVIWVALYAARIKRRPQASSVYELDESWRTQLSSQVAMLVPLTARRVLCFVLMIATVILMMFGLSRLQWRTPELGAVFLALAIVLGSVSGIRPGRLAELFVSGVREFASAALIIAFANGVLVILKDGQVLDRIIYALTSTAFRLDSLTSSAPGLRLVVQSWTVYVMQGLLCFVIPSATGAASLTIKMLASLTDSGALGITKQTIVLAFQFGAGFTCMIVPTSGVTMGTLGLARIPYARWARWFWRLEAGLVLLSLIFLVWPALTYWP